MSRTTNNLNKETFTFRLDHALKDALTRSAADRDIRPAELVRGLVRDYITVQAHQAFEREARQQSLAIARRAKKTDSDEAQILREISADLDRDDFAEEWKA